MSNIYVITNKLNGKQYVGQTHFSINERFKRHITDSKKCDRPLYRAFKKYGIENFAISLLEETNEPNEREIYWIKKLNTYSDGYNATLGGEGTLKIDYNLLDNLWLNGKSIKEISEILKCDKSTITKYLRDKNINIKETIKRGINYRKKKIEQYDLNNNLLNTFDGCRDAARFLGDENKNKHISECANGKRKTAYGYIWKYAEIA